MMGLFFLLLLVLTPRPQKRPTPTKSSPNPPLNTAPNTQPPSPHTYEAVSVLASAALEAAGGLRRDVLKRIRGIYGGVKLEVGVMLP